jgi:hypothetical protein
MIRLLLIMHHIALCISCTAHFNLSHLDAYSDKSRRTETWDLRGVSPRGVQRSISVKL